VTSTACHHPSPCGKAHGSKAELWREQADSWGKIAQLQQGPHRSSARAFVLAITRVVLPSRERCDVPAAYRPPGDSEEGLLSLPSSLSFGVLPSGETMTLPTLFAALSLLAFPMQLQLLLGQTPPAQMQTPPAAKPAPGADQKATSPSATDSMAPNSSSMNPSAYGPPAISPAASANASADGGATSAAQPAPRPTPSWSGTRKGPDGGILQ
jgi:hypothetical protein